MKGFGAFAAVGLLLSACTNPGVTSLQTNAPLAPAPDLAGAATPGSVVWRSPDLAQQERAASSYLIPPATVYRGKGARFSDLSPEQVDQIAADLTKDVRAEIGRRFKVVNASGPGVITLDLIVARITPPHPVYSTSGPNEVPELEVGMPATGQMTAGTLTISGKFSDSQTGKLLVAFVSPVSPQVMDLANPGSPERALDFAQAANRQFANDLVNAIVRQRQNNGVPLPK